MTNATRTPPAVQVYRVYIKATPEAIWDAITKPEWTDRYGYGGRAEYDLRPGGAYRGMASAGMLAQGAPDVAVDGEVIEVDPPRKLVQTWRMAMDPTAAAEGFTRLTYEISEGDGGVTSLTVTHDLSNAPTTATLVAGALEEQGAGGGWSWVLSDLKTLLETGKAFRPEAATGWVGGGPARAAPPHRRARAARPAPTRPPRGRDTGGTRRAEVATIDGTSGAFAVRSGARTLTLAGGTQVGLRYRANFDVLYLAGEPPLAVVADGMGDGEGSAVASRTAVDVFVTELLAAGRPPDPAKLRHAVAEAHRRVRAAGAHLGLTGCTLTALLPTSLGDAWIAQVGDSRAYRHRAGLLELLTVDHTRAWLGAVYGWYPADSPQAAADRYRLHRYVGHPDSPEPDVLNVALHPGDVLCLCTDGLAEQVPYQRLAQVLGSGGQPGEQVAALLADALAAGGRDNATLAVLRVD
jgi:serine/threonine protein phosphatase PrpC/uncharacterized protein YndB with AHSA1/START domain